MGGAPAADGGDQTRNVAMGDDSQSFATTFVTKAAASANVGPTQVWGGGEAAEEESQDSDFRANIVTSTVRSEAWWLYAQMLSKLNQYPADLSAWCEGCACHPWLFQQQQQRDSAGVDIENRDLQVCEVVEAVRKDLGYASGQGDGRYFRPCPLAGQRAAELASGEIWQQIDAWNTGYLQDILQGNACTDQTEIDAALKDFSIGKSLIVEYLQHKLQCWESLPWKLAALNSTDTGAARRAAAEAMAAYDRLVADGATVTELHHSCEIDAESQTDLQGLKTKVIEAEALESSGLVEALVAYPKGAEKEQGDAAASSSAVKREAPPGLEEKGAEPDMETAVTSIIWLSGEVDYDPPSGLPVVALAVPATMNETPLDAPETAEAEEAAPAASKAEDEEKTEGAADPAAEKAEEEEAAMLAAAA